MGKKIEKKELMVRMEELATISPIKGTDMLTKIKGILLYKTILSIEEFNDSCEADRELIRGMRRLLDSGLRDKVTYNLSRASVLLINKENSPVGEKETLYIFVSSIEGVSNFMYLVRMRKECSF